MECFFLSFGFGHFKCSKSMFPLKMRQINYGMHIYTERKPRKKTLGILTFLLYFFDTADLYKKKVCAHFDIIHIHESDKCAMCAILLFVIGIIYVCTV